MESRWTTGEGMWDTHAMERLASRLPDSPPSSRQDLPAELELFADDVIRIVYMPYGYVNPSAKIAILGLTPGWKQVQIAYQIAIDAIRKGACPIEAHRMKKPAVAFAGEMRKNLVQMLDELKLHTYLGFRSTGELFESDALHATSALRFPVFTQGRDYSGRSPSPTKHPALLGMIDELLAPELEAVSGALVVPLGRAASECVARLCTQGRLETSRCMFGFPHPSGANVHRIPQFKAEESSMRAQLRAWFEGEPSAS